MTQATLIKIKWKRLAPWPWIREGYDALDESDRKFFASFLAAMADRRDLMGAVWKKLQSRKETFAPEGPLLFVLKLTWRAHASMIGMERHRSQIERKTIADKVVGAVDELILQLDRLKGAHLFEGYPTAIQSKISEAIQESIRDDVRCELESFEHEIEPDELNDLQANIEDAAVRSLVDVEAVLTALRSGTREWADETSPRLNDVLVSVTHSLTQKFGGRRELSLAAALVSVAIGRDVSVDSVKEACNAAEKKLGARTSTG